MTPSVSVVIPCHNATPWLDATLHTLLNQSLPPAEVILVDDGSTDASVAVAERHPQPVTVLRLDGVGASAARNAGVAQARGDAIMFLDADDLIAPDTLAALAATLAAHPGAIACCPWYRWELTDGAWQIAPPSCTPRRPGQDDLAAWLTGWYHPPCALLWSRAALDRSGGWDAAIRVNTDGDVIMRALVAGVSLRQSAGGTGFYRRLPGEGVSLSGRRKTRTGLESRLRVVERIGALLDRQGRLDRYRAPLAEACDTLAAQARPAHPDLDRRCLEAATRFSGGLAPPGEPDPVDPSGADPARAAERSTAPMPASPHADAAGALVSVIIPSFNRAHTLARAVDSVLAQDHAHLELLLVDDCSTDDTVARFGAHPDPRLRVLRQPHNAGVSAARNRGIAEARGAYLAFLDSDDEWLPDKLSRQLACFAAGSHRLGLVYTNLETEEEEDGRRWVGRATHAGDLYRTMLTRHVVYGAGSNALVSRAAIEVVGGFDTGLTAIEDYEFCLRIARFFTVDYVDAPLLRYHASSGEMLERDRRSRHFDNNMGARQQLYARYGREMQRQGVDHLFLLDSARRHIEAADGSRWTGMRLLARALRRHPGAYPLYPWVPFALLPGRLRRHVPSPPGALALLERPSPQMEIAQ